MPTSLTNPFGLTNALDAATGPGAYSDNMWYKWESLKNPAIQMALQERYRTNSLYRSLVATTAAAPAAAPWRRNVARAKRNRHSRRARPGRRWPGPSRRAGRS